MKHVHCPVNGWGCPYYVGKKILPSDNGPKEEECLCEMDDPMGCEDFLFFWDDCEPEEYTDDTNEEG